jgi:hypothetical protein
MAETASPDSLDQGSLSGALCAWSDSCSRRPAAMAGLSGRTWFGRRRRCRDRHGLSGGPPECHHRRLPSHHRHHDQHDRLGSDFSSFGMGVLSLLDLILLSTGESVFNAVSYCLVGHPELLAEIRQGTERRLCRSQCNVKRWDRSHY